MPNTENKQKICDNQTTICDDVTQTENLIEQDKDEARKRDPKKPNEIIDIPIKPNE